MLTDLQRSDHLASSLSDGTLRFLALAILEASPHGPSLLCLEEPENGIHPERIPAMISLLEDLAVDVHTAAGSENPMRQIIVNTHSPGVVECVPEGALVLADSVEQQRGRTRERYLVLRGMPMTWRDEGGPQSSLIPLMSYLAPAPWKSSPGGEHGRDRRVIDREDVRQLVLSLEPPPSHL